MTPLRGAPSTRGWSPDGVGRCGGCQLGHTQLLPEITGQWPMAVPRVSWLELRSSFGWIPRNLVPLLREQLFIYRDLMSWLNQCSGPPLDLLAVQRLRLRWDQFDSTSRQKQDPVPRNGRFPRRGPLFAIRHKAVSN